MNRKPAPLVNAIQVAAKLKKVGMIAMVSEASPMESVFVGSTTRKVIRGSGLPVWVIHIHSAKETKAQIPKGVPAAA